MTEALPVTLEEARERGWEELDVVLVTGDAYVDHPSFGPAVIGRVLEAGGYRVGIMPQPDWRRREEFQRFGRPLLFFGVTAGNLDSMVTNYSPQRRPRRKDSYSPGGKPGRRPDRATLVYSAGIRGCYRDVPIVLGGIEASLRRLAHYDYWEDTVRQSVLADSPAQVLVYGMGERQVLEIARRLADGEGIGDIRGVPGTAVKARDPPAEGLELPSFGEVSTDRKAYARAWRYQEDGEGLLFQRHPKTIVVQNPPPPPMPPGELDRIYELPYTRRSHPSYLEEVPALKPVQFSVTTHRGCFGSCSFCALTVHQGRIVQSRSKASVLREARALTRHPDFRGVIQDVGGPTANMYMLSCERQRQGKACKDRLCLFPEICSSLETDHGSLIGLLRELRAIKGVSHVFIGSGIRYDLALEDQAYLLELCRYHVSGQLKVAPEHIAPKVLDAMGKPPREKFERFLARYKETNEALGLEQYVIPYFISGHPGCTIDDMVALAEYIREMGFFIEQVQDFTPTPMTLSTCMYHTGLDPRTMEPIHVPRGEEKMLQRALLQFRDPRNQRLVYEALRRAGRMDLVGRGKRCLIAPPSP